MRTTHSTVTLERNEDGLWQATCREKQDGKSVGVWRSFPVADITAAKIDQDMHTYNPGTVRGHRTKPGKADEIKTDEVIDE